MGLLTRTLTEPEKTAIIALEYGFLQDWPSAYVAAIAEDPETVRSNPYFHDYVSKWKRTAKVQNYVLYVKRQKALKEEDLIRKAQQQEEEFKSWNDESEKGIERTKKEQTRREIDYTDPNEQRKKLNQLIRDATDPGDALDALKVIITGQRDDRQAAREGRQVRAYLPMICHNCPLYQAQKAKTEPRQ